MKTIGKSESAAFFRDVEAATKKAVWCALATQSKDGARVRIVHPTWEGETLWFATGTGTPKTREIAKRYLQVQNDAMKRCAVPR